MKDGAPGRCSRVEFSGLSVWGALRLSHRLCMMGRTVVCGAFDLDFFCDADGACSLPEVRGVSLSYLQLFSEAAVVGC